MSVNDWVRKHKDAECTISAPYSAAFDAALFAAGQVGRPLFCDPAAGCLTVEVPSRFFPYSNPVTLHIALRENANGSCHLRIDANSMDGIVGVNSAGRTIRRFLDAMQRQHGVI